jgi:peptide/nickel transport system permease protein
VTRSAACGATRTSPAEQIHSIEHSKNLDKPVIVRYGYWIRDAVTKQFGTTLFGNRKIWPDLKRVMGHTLQFILSAIIISLILGDRDRRLLGVTPVLAVRLHRHDAQLHRLRHPVFWLALMLQVLMVQIYLKWNVGSSTRPACRRRSNAGTASTSCSTASAPRAAVIALCALSTATYSRFMRASMLEVLNSDYVRTARAKGLIERRVVMRHAFRNALIPLITVVALDFGGLFAGAIVTETIFTLDGMGFYFVNSLFASDPYR